MHLVLIAAGQGNELSTQHIHLQHGTGGHAPSRFVDLLVLDARHMHQGGIEAAMKAVADIRTRHGFRHGVLLCAQPALPLVVSAIRIGLRDVISQYISAAHLRQLLRSAIPSLTRREYRSIVAFLRAFNAFSSTNGHSVPLARQSEELDRRKRELDEQTKIFEIEKDRLARADQEIRERTRRLDRQIARLQNDSDVSGLTSSPFATGSASPMPDTAAQSRRLDQRAAELDLREKLLNEMQTLLLSTPQAAGMSAHLSLALGAPKPTRTYAGAAA